MGSGLVRVQPNQLGGVSIAGKTPFADFRIEVDSKGNVASHRITIGEHAKQHARNEAEARKPRTKKRVRWMGIEWMGTPAPIRIARLPARILTLIWRQRGALWGDGCGCIRSAKLRVWSWSRRRAQA